MTSFGIGGVASELYEPQSLSEFQEVLERLAGREPFILGRGCNTLFPDSSFTRPVVAMHRLCSLSLDGATLRAEAGVRTDVLLRTALRAGLGGLEPLVGIPGTVGGATVMNAGGGGWSVAERVVELGLVPECGGNVVRVSGREIPWGYRSWNLHRFHVAWVRFGLDSATPARLRARIADLARRKNSTQPMSERSAGCIFKNPPGCSAGALIDRLGFKGRRSGGAEVSERHANFIINRDGTAQAADVLRLIDEIRRRVFEAFHIRLETEVVIAGCSLS
jgi:UDP-N-acetylmuramate dehydrogenase